MANILIPLNRSFGKFPQLFDRLPCLPLLKTSAYFLNRTENYADSSTELSPEDDKFRTLQFTKKQKKVQTERRKKDISVPPPRYKKMPVDQDWTNVWPAARTFNPSVVPFPVRQGFTKINVAPPGKFGNTELIKIPNFLHLTPPAIKKHCAAIKKFCTPWPKGLHTDELCEKHFPVEIVSNDYCNSGPSIRDPKARIVSLKIRVALLSLDEHAKDKLLRLVGDRYDEKTDILTITVDRCPHKKQNYDYTHFLLTALYHEAQNTASWESEKTLEDMEKYVWTQNISSSTIKELITKLKEVDKKENISASSDFSWLQSIPEDSPLEKLSTVEPIASYAEAVTTLHNEGEDAIVLSKYKASVKTLLGLPSDTDKC